MLLAVVANTHLTHRGTCAGWGRSRECSHQSDAQRRLRAEIRSSVRARCRLPRVARVSLSLRCARAPFGQRVREARIEGGCASRRTLRMPLFRYQGSSRAGGKESSPSKGCFHTLHQVRDVHATLLTGAIHTAESRHAGWVRTNFRRWHWRHRSCPCWQQLPGDPRAPVSRAGACRARP